MTTTKREPRASALWWAWEWFKVLATAALIFLVVRTFLVEAYTIPTGSMEGTLLAGDFLLVNKVAYGAELPFAAARLPPLTTTTRGDIVVFLPPHEPGKSYVKRVVGIPGDTLQMRDKALYVNGQVQDEPYARVIDFVTDPADARMHWQVEHLVGGSSSPADYRPSRDNWGPLIVPSARYFAMGDNRDNSEDSRHWGFLEEGSIRGRPMFIYYSFERSLERPFSWLTGVRLERIGDAIR